MNLLYILLVLLLITRLCGEIAERVGQPALVGELIAGIGLGMLLHHYSGSFPILAELPDNEVFKGIVELSIFFLMLLAGIELRPSELAEASGRALAVAVGGMLIPFALGFGLGWLFLPDSSYKIAQALFLATAMAITAVPVSVKVLMDLGRLNTPLGRTIVSAAVFDDILSLMLLAGLTAMIKTGGPPSPAEIALLAVKVACFFLITWVFGRFLLSRLIRLLENFRAEEFEFSALLITALIFAVLAEALSMHFILGAFMAGLFFVRSAIKTEVFDTIKSSLTSFTTGLFAPLFFASIGLHLDLGAAAEIPLFVVLLVAVAFLGKLLGAGLPAMTAGFAVRDSLAIGAAMSGRGAVELIIAGIALEAGLFDHPDPAPPEVANLFSAVIIMALVTTLITPLLMRPLLGSKKQGD